MLVKDLIRRLERLPKTAEVVVRHEGQDDDLGGVVNLYPHRHIGAKTGRVFRREAVLEIAPDPEPAGNNIQHAEAGPTQPEGVAT